MSRQLHQAYFALAAICIIWGTTYTAIKFAVRDFPPYLLVGIRQTAAGMLLLVWAVVSGRVRPAVVPPALLGAERSGAPALSAGYVWRQMLTGLCTIAGGNGFITWGMQHVSSGVAAVIGSLTPVVVVLINLSWKGAERLNALVIGGVLLGFGGLGLIFRDGWADFLHPDYRWGILACFGSCFTWSLGTVMAKRWNDPRVSPALNAGIQITAGGIGGFGMSLLFDPTHTITHTTQGWLAVSYLALVGSALAFTLYMFALNYLSATVSSLYTYINPVVAILLGWALLGERLSLWELVGMGVTIAGVWLVNRGYLRGAG
ncbi:MAG: EamA family transporter [Saprospirales bacterium]|jgi:drug/metabolite transporter (DMT)-like permease|nr:EamA family transporter [Saprospirales bacterium]MBK8922511.1 EamA family transporter [Saprospirales bacterium]